MNAEKVNSILSFISFAESTQSALNIVKGFSVREKKLSIYCTSTRREMNSKEEKFQQMN